MNIHFLVFSCAFFFFFSAAFAVNCSYDVYQDTQCAAYPDTPYCVDWTCHAVAEPTLYCSDSDNNSIYSSGTIDYRTRDYAGRFITGPQSDTCMLNGGFVTSCTSSGCRVRETVCTNTSTGTFDFIETDCPQGCSNGACTATCFDGVKNQSETDVDCGGPNCTAYDCANGKTCTSNSDCQSDYCLNSVCSVASCFDGIQNQTESDVDCGGSCNPCANGKQCNQTSDCNSSMCINNLCQALSSCTDGIKNGSETGIDCGGGSCPTCANGQPCTTYSDCNSSICTNSVCTAAASCSDGIKNGVDIDIDCGRYCPSKCADGLHCELSIDCNSNICTGGVCQPVSGGSVTCSNGVKDTLETDIDCGRYCPTKCELSKTCEVAVDCQSNTCVLGICTIAFHCTNEIQDQNETGVDCGGTDCIPCGSLFCTNNLYNIGETDVDCGGNCPPCDLNKYCGENSDCASNSCHNSVCVDSNNTCFNGLLNQTESDTDCGGSCAQKCDLNKSCRIDADCNSNYCVQNKCQVDSFELPETVDTAALLYYVEQWAKTTRGEDAEVLVTDRHLLQVIDRWRTHLGTPN